MLDHKPLWGPEAGIAATAVLALAKQTLSRQFGISEGDAGVAITQVAVQSLVHTAPNSAAAYLTAIVALERARMMKSANQIGADRQMKKAMEAYSTAFHRFYDEGMSRQAARDGGLH